ncbi:MAG: hypothetical protein ACI4EK_00845 [Wujia sp.]
MNRFYASFKRICAKRLYLVMLLLLLVMTVCYQLLPEKSQSTDIKVAVCIDSDKQEELWNELNHATTLYSFYPVSSESDVISDVQAQKAECGFYVPEHFFDSFCAGDTSEKIIAYTTPSTTLYATINETFFHYIFKVAAPDILVDTLGDPSMEEELRAQIENYMNGDEVFQMSSITEGNFHFSDMTYRIDFPIREFAGLMIIFSALLGLYLYQKDAERDIFLALTKKDLLGIKWSMIFAAILPALFIGCIACLLTYGLSGLWGCLIVTGVSLLLALLLSKLVRSSKRLTVLFPLLLFLSILYFFVTYIL